MTALDHQIAQLANSHSLLVVLAVALLLGLRHASDPDHLAAVSTLIASDPTDGARRAGRLGLAWGLGHATTLTVFGLPIVLFKSYLPEGVQRVAEMAVGILIMALAIRLLVRWRQGRFHAHSHRHGGIEHRHLHTHEEDVHHSHDHEAAALLGRSPLQAYSIGLVHGMAGSAGIGVLLLAGINARGQAVGALILFAAATAASMAMLSSGFGYALARGPVFQRARVLAPAFGLATLAFGAWYAIGALTTGVYPL